MILFVIGGFIAICFIVIALIHFIKGDTVDVFFYLIMAGLTLSICPRPVVKPQDKFKA